MTPRPYLSWSQMQLLERSPEQYRKVYILGEPGYHNREMGFGTRVADMLERDELSGDPAHDFVLSQVPRLDLPEHLIEVELKIGKKRIPLTARIDSLAREWDDLLEYKTGRQPWTQSRADKHGQISFYDTCIWLARRLIPSNRVVWIPTENGDEGEVRFTGDPPKVIETARSMKDVLEMMARMEKAWDLIQQMTNEALV